MSSPGKRTTVYFDPVLHQALRLKSATVARSISQLVNDAVRQSLAEDAEDITAFTERVNEPLVSYDDMVTRLRKDGLL
jgi:hypothetical protein